MCRNTTPPGKSTLDMGTGTPYVPPPMTELAPVLVARVAAELSLNPNQVRSTLALFGEGATLPFIARYRKEATGGLDEVQLRDVRDRTEDRRERRRDGGARRP